MAKSDLLEEVAEHKSVFFPAAWPHFATARIGSLRLSPPAARLGELEQDYAKMEEMIFGTRRSFAELLAALAALEEAINAP